MQDGSIVDAKKDCACSHHAGPHWLHMDKVIAEYVAACRARGEMSEALAQENDRLLEMAHQMHIQGIARIIRLRPPPTDPQPDFLAPPPHTLGFVLGMVDDAIAKYGEDAECQFVGCYGATGVIEDVGVEDDASGIVNFYTTFCSG